jgi:hypothetical protein
MQTARLRLRTNASFAALAGIGMWFGLSPAAAQGTPEQRAACENDAMRLCSDANRRAASISGPACPPKIDRMSG